MNELISAYGAILEAYDKAVGCPYCNAQPGYDCSRTNTRPEHKQGCLAARLIPNARIYTPPEPEKRAPTPEGNAQ